jgi:hypothetical protein
LALNRRCGAKRIFFETRSPSSRTMAIVDRRGSAGIMPGRTPYGSPISPRAVPLRS